MENSYNLPAWCYGIYFFYYIVFFYIISNSKRNTLEVLKKYIVLFVIGIVVFNSNLSLSTLINKPFARGAMGFSIGCLIAELYTHKKLFNTIVIGRICSVLVIGLYLVYRVNDIAGNMDMVFITLVAPLVVLCFLFDPIVNKVFSYRLFSSLGNISMEIYLLHFPIYLGLQIIESRFSINIDYSRRISWILFVIVSISICVLFRWFVEKTYLSLFKQALQNIKKLILNYS